MPVRSLSHSAGLSPAQPEKKALSLFSPCRQARECRNPAHRTPDVLNAVTFKPPRAPHAAHTLGTLAGILLDDGDGEEGASLLCARRQRVKSRGGKSIVEVTGTALGGFLQYPTHKSQQVCIAAQCRCLRLPQREIKLTQWTDEETNGGHLDQQD